MKLRILGNNGPYPGKNSACSAYLLSSDSKQTNILIDFGTGALCRLPNYIDFSEIDAIILSHLHFDHMSDMLPMQYALQFNPRSAIPLYAPKTPEKALALLDAPCYELHPMENASIGETEVFFLPVRHPVESYAVKIVCDGKTFIYTGDTNEVDALDTFAAEADLLLADAGLSSADWSQASPHLSAGGCGRLAARCKAKKLLLTHLNPKYTAEAHESEAKCAFPNVQFCEIGAEYRI